MLKRFICVFLTAVLVITLSGSVDVHAQPELIDMDILFMHDSELWEQFPIEVRASYVVYKYEKDIQDWYKIPEEEQLPLENFILYSYTMNKKYNSSLSFCLYPDDRFVYINRNRFGEVGDDIPGCLFAVGVLAHELCHIKQMKEGRASEDPSEIEALEIECNTNAANYLYYLTGNEYVFNNYKAVSYRHVHTH